MRTRTGAEKGFTLVEIMIVIAIIGLLAAIAIPNFLRHREYTQTQACIANLSKIDSAKHIWGVENKKSTTDVPEDSDLFGAVQYIKVKPECPASGTYTLQEIGVHPTCDVLNHEL